MRTKAIVDDNMLLKTLDERIRDIAREVLNAEMQKYGLQPREYSQRDGERPPGIGHTAYLRIWRRLFKEGASGLTRHGKSRMMSHDAWTSHLRRAPMPIAAPPGETIAEEVFRDLMEGKAAEDARALAASLERHLVDAVTGTPIVLKARR